MVDEIKTIEIVLSLEWKRRKTIPLVKISSEREVKITPNAKGKEDFIIFKKSGTAVTCSDPNFIDRNKEVLYNAIPKTTPINN